MPSKPQFVGEKVKLGELLLDTFSGEWGTEEGESLIPVLRTSNFNEDGSFDYSTPAMRCIPERKVTKKRMVRGDIILEKSGGTPKRPVGIMAFYDSDALALCSNFNQVLRFDADRILPKFAFHQLRWLKDRNAFYRYTRKTTGLQNLQMNKLVELKLCVPQIEIQTSIAATLDEIVGNQRALQQGIAGFDSLAKSRFVEMFGDPVDGAIWTMQQLANLYEVKSSKRIYAREQTKRGVPFLRLADVGSLIDSGMADSGLFISEERFEELKAKGQVPAPDDVLVTARGTLGRCYMIKSADRFYFQDGMITWLAAGENSPLPSYLLAIFDNPHFIEQLNNNCSGTTVKYLSISDLANVAVPVPPLALQQEFASFVSQVDKSRFIARQQIEKLQMLYDKLAQDYFG